MNRYRKEIVTNYQTLGQGISNSRKVAPQKLSPSSFHRTTITSSKGTKKFSLIKYREKIETFLYMQLPNIQTGHSICQTKRIYIKIIEATF